MRIIRSHTGLDPDARGAAAAIGNFDGVHLGHQAVLDQARAAADTLGAPLGVVTFEPHPRQLFQPDAPPFRLMNAETRAHRLQRLGVQYLYELPFSPKLTALSPDDFAQSVIADGLGLRHVVVGQDFRFGAKRAGDVDTLVRLGGKLGFGVTVAPLLQEDGIGISSTRIRQALTDGNPRAAAAMLGHLHRIDGPVIHGEKRGRTLNYPTANMDLTGLHLPKFGVYAVTVDILDGPHAGPATGVASLGVRPMFGENVANLETFLFDFTGDLYGAHLSVGLVEFLRGEEKFDSLDTLIEQMDADSAAARRILS